jgi:hypothetical protein
MYDKYKVFDLSGTRLSARLAPRRKDPTHDFFAKQLGAPNHLIFGRASSKKDL